MDVKGDLGFAGAIALAVGATIGIIAGVVYLVVTVAKWAWGG